MSEEMLSWLVDYHNVQGSVCGNSEETKTAEGCVLKVHTSCDHILIYWLERSALTAVYCPNSFF